jgi:hypothetical protein
MAQVKAKLLQDIDVYKRKKQEDKTANKVEAADILTSLIRMNGTHILAEEKNFPIKPAGVHTAFWQKAKGEKWLGKLASSPSEFSGFVQRAQQLALQDLDMKPSAPRRALPSGLSYDEVADNLAGLINHDNQNDPYYRLDMLAGADHDKMNYDLQLTSVSSGATTLGSLLETQHLFSFLQDLVPPDLGSQLHIVHNQGNFTIKVPHAVFELMDRNTNGFRSIPAISAPSSMATAPAASSSTAHVVNHPGMITSHASMPPIYQAPSPVQSAPHYGHAHVAHGALFQNAPSETKSAALDVPIQNMRKAEIAEKLKNKVPELTTLLRSSGLNITVEQDGNIKLVFVGKNSGKDSRAARTALESAIMSDKRLTEELRVKPFFHSVGGGTDLVLHPDVLQIFLTPAPAHESVSRPLGSAKKR